MLILFFRFKGGRHISESSLLPRLKSKKASTISIEVLGVSAISLSRKKDANHRNIKRIYQA